MLCSGFSVAVIGKAKVNWEKQESSSHRSGDEVTIEYYTSIKICVKNSELKSHTVH